MTSTTMFSAVSLGEVEGLVSKQQIKLVFGKFVVWQFSIGFPEG